jgi:hypothetical protein
VYKNRKLPREGVANRDGDIDGAASLDGDASAKRDGDTEGHRANLVRRDDTTSDAFPRRPSSGGELTDDDVEGHRAAPALPRLPGTGGDAFPRRPSSGGEFTDEDDVEGHVD